MKTILIVDDFVAMRKTIGVILEEHGYRTVHAGGADNALTLLFDPGISIDLVLADFFLPDKNGFELLHEIRHRSLKPDIPVVFMSAEQHPALQFRKVGLNFSAWIKKPVNPEMLIFKVRRMLA